MNVDEAWDEFSRTSSIKKTSVKGMLDTMAAQLNEIQATSARTAELVPKILGDNAAIDTVNEEMGGDMMGGQMGSAPDMGGAPMEDPGMGTPSEDMTGGEPPMTDEEIMPEQGTEDVPLDEEMGGEDLGPEGAPEGAPMDDGGLGDEAMLGDDLGAPEDDLLEDDLGDEIDDTEMMGAPEDIPTGGRKSLDEIAIELIKEGKRDEAQTILDAAARLEGQGAVDEPMDGLGEGLGDEAMPEGPMIGEDEDSDLMMDEGDDLMMDEDVAAPEGTETEEVSETETEEPAPTEGEGAEDKVEDKTEEKTEEKTEKTEKSAIKKEDIGTVEGPGSPDSTSMTESSDDTKEKVGEIMAEAVGKVMDAIDGKDTETEEPEKGEVEVEVIDESAPNEEKNEELVEGEHVEECGCANTKPVKLSATDVTCREMFEARMRGEDALAPFVKSAEEITDFAEFDPWGQSKFSIFKSSETIADEVSDASTDLKGNSGNGGSQLEEVNEEKGMSDHSVGGDEPLDSVDEEKGMNDHSVAGGEPIDEVKKEDGGKNKQGETDDLLDTVDQEEPTGVSGKGGDMLDDVSTKKSSTEMNGKTIPTLRDMMAIRKSGSRPDATSSANGELNRPELGKITKSSSEPVRMGRGVDPRKVTENDWNEYNLFKSRQTF